MWKVLNSPIIIVIVVLFALFIFDKYKKPPAATELRGIYNELLLISEDATGDLEKRKIISSFVKEAGKQLREGFNVFNNDEQKKKKAIANKHYFEVRSKITISKPKVMETKRYNQVQKQVIYQVTNNSTEYLSKVAHTIEFYYQDDLLEVKDEWGNIKLAPGETKSYSYKIENKKLVFTNIKILIGDITIMPVAQ